MKMLRTIFTLCLLAAAAGSGRPAAAQQQVTPYGQQAIVMNSVVNPAVTPTGASAATCHPPVSAGNTCEIQSLGQNVHYLTYFTTVSGSGSVGGLDIRLEASFTNAAGSYFAISADSIASTAFNSGNPAAGAVCAVGYYPYIRANLVAFAGSGSPAPTLTALYSGTSSTSGCPKGTYNPSQDITEVALSSGSADTSATMSLNTPFGNSYGTLYVFSANLHSGGTIAVSSLGATETGNNLSTTFLAYQTLNTNTGQAFQVPLPFFPTQQVSVAFTSGGSSSGTISAFIVFSPPPQQSGMLGCHITTATNTACKSAPGTVGVAGIGGTLFSVTINQIGTSTGTAAIYDGALSGGSCTGTLIATANVGSNIGTLWYDQQFFTGLCVTTTGATPADITVNYR